MSKKEEKQQVEMRDLSAYKPAEIDVLSLIKKEMAKETEVFGEPLLVRVYPTPYMLKLANQLTEATGTPHVYNQNYFELGYDKTDDSKFVIIGSCSNDELRYLHGKLTDERLKVITPEDRNLQLNLEPLDIYKALTDVSGEF
jgi:hypothetical protein